MRASQDRVIGDKADPPARMSSDGNSGCSVAALRPMTRQLVTSATNIRLSTRRRKVFETILIGAPGAEFQSHEADDDWPPRRPYERPVMSAKAQGRLLAASFMDNAMARQLAAGVHDPYQRGADCRPTGASASFGVTQIGTLDAGTHRRAIRTASG